jgi:hypothetical protein
VREKEQARSLRSQEVSANRVWRAFLLYCQKKRRKRGRPTSNWREFWYEGLFARRKGREEHYETDSTTWLCSYLA